MKFVIDMKLENWNDIIKDCRYSKFYANKQKQREMNKMVYYITDIPKITKYPVKIVFKWHMKRTNADLDNKSCKSILDCMQKLGKLENDDIKHITEITHIAIKDDKEFVEVEIM